MLYSRSLSVICFIYSSVYCGTLGAGPSGRFLNSGCGSFPGHCWCVDGKGEYVPTSLAARSAQIPQCKRSPPDPGGGRSSGGCPLPAWGGSVGQPFRRAPEGSRTTPPPVPRPGRLSLGLALPNRCSSFPRWREAAAGERGPQVSRCTCSLRSFCHFCSFSGHLTSGLWSSLSPEFGPVQSSAHITAQR